MGKIRGQIERGKKNILMKIKFVIVGGVVCAAAVAVSGCKKEQPATETQTPKVSESVTPAPAAPAAAQAVTSAVTKAVETATTAAQPPTNQATTQVKAAEGQAQGIIDRAKSYVAEKKYQNALSSLGELKNLQLTPDQQKLVDSLKTQIQSALTKDAATDVGSAVGGVLGGDKK